MPDVLETVLLLALPASGKSEIRRYLRHLPAEEAARDFHMGPSVQLDDFPYVHLMRRIDEELASLGKPRLFFHALDRSFQDGRLWGALIHLVNEDYADLAARRIARPDSAARLLFDRVDAAADRVGARPRLGSLDGHTLDALAKALEAEARQELAEKQASYPERLEGRTVVIEFARGGPKGSSMPLPEPLGYRYSLAQLSPAILEKAVILYVWVTPEESRRKNDARADPSDPGSILHHSVPPEVMHNDYGCDDMDWLEASAGVPGTVTVEAHGRTWTLPVARFDNRVDKTSFLRGDPRTWKPEEVRAVHDGLKRALDDLFTRACRRV